MPASRCVVQDRKNIAGPGILIHKSSTDRKNRIKWVNFVRHHRANFFIGPEQRFAVEVGIVGQGMCPLQRRFAAMHIT